MLSALSHLECSECGKHHEADRPQTVCRDCASPLLARYDLEMARREITPAAVRGGPRGIWRWAPLLPVRKEANRLTLGEGDTPWLDSLHVAGSIGLRHVVIKDESCNPTGSFKARGLAVAVSRAIELGIQEFSIPTAGNAGAALAAYAARAGLPAHVYMPEDSPPGFQREIACMGADLKLVHGLIGEAGLQAAAAAHEHGWFNLATFKEPYRLEGKKTMGFELVGQFGAALPDVIIYPTGGGTGLIGMWKAFGELQALGWIRAARPRMVSVQAEGCAPVVRAFREGAATVDPWAGAETIAAGLRVPAPFAGRLILRTIRESGGTAISVSDGEIETAQEELASKEGLLAGPEGAATWAALKQLAKQGWINADDRVVLFNTGSGLKY